MTQQSPHILNKIYSVLMDRFYQACKDLGLTISLKKTNVLGQDVNTSPVITINNYKLEVVQQFTYLGSTISENMSLDAEINKPIGKAARTLGQLIIHVWENPKLTTPAKIVVYNVCIVSTLLKGSETWTTYAKQELEGQSAKCSGSCPCQPPHNVHAAQTT